MGIRFRCPNGHKIHVKAFLAGKRGICPKCGLKVAIPQESDPEFGGKSSATAGISPPSRRSTSPKHPSPADGVESPSPARRGPTRPTPTRIPEAEVPTAAPSGIDSKAATATDSSQGTPSVDPIAAAPLAKWFVRPPSGGQFGPAPGPLLRDWIAEGRVTADSYLWREGWPEWQRAKSVFDNLGASADARPSSPLPSIVTETGSHSTTELYRRRKSSKMTFTVVGLLGLTCAVLFAALVYVVRFMK